ARAEAVDRPHLLPRAALGSAERLTRLRRPPRQRRRQLHSLCRLDYDDPCDDLPRPAESWHMDVPDRRRRELAQRSEARRHVCRHETGGGDGSLERTARSKLSWVRTASGASALPQLLLEQREALREDRVLV